MEVPCTIRDARLCKGLDLDTSGFQLVRAPTSLAPSEFFCAAAVTGRYYTECAELLRGITGAAVVIPFDHNVRSSKVELFADDSSQPPTAKNGSDGDIAPDGPVMFVHNDYTDKSGPQRVLDIARGGSYTLSGSEAQVLSLAEAEDLVTAGKQRYAFVNIWRPIRHPVVDVPLAVCDARSMRAEDFAACQLVYPDRVGETHVIRHRPEHEVSRS